MKVKKLLQCGNGDIEDCLSKLADNVDDDPSINVAKYPSAISRRKGKEPQLPSTIQSPRGGGAMITVPPCQLNSGTTPFHVQHLSTTCNAHCRQFVPQKPTSTPLRRTCFSNVSKCTKGTIDLDDEDGSTPFLNHISELVDDIVQKSTGEAPHVTRGKVLYS